MLLKVKLLLSLGAIGLVSTTGVGLAYLKNEISNVEEDPDLGI